jgi:hypothetical protein
MSEQRLKEGQKASHRFHLTQSRTKDAPAKRQKKWLVSNDWHRPVLIW